MNKFLVFVCLSVISCSTGIIDDDAPTDCPVQNGFVASPGYTYQLLSENIFQHSNLDIQYWDEEIGYFLEKSSPFRFMRTLLMVEEIGLNLIDLILQVDLSSELLKRELSLLVF